MTAEPSSPQQDLDIISRFLAALDRPAAGHARAELTPAQRAEIEALARGQLDGDAQRRSALVPLLCRNETAIEYLTSLLKSQPQPPPPQGPAAEGDEAPLG